MIFFSKSNLCTLRTSLILSSCVMKRKGGSAWITSILWSRPRSPNFSTSQSRSLSRQTGFFECEYPLIDLTDGHNWACCCKRMAIRPGFETILTTCCACSTKILLDSCSLSIEEAKERLCWQGVIICIDPIWRTCPTTSWHLESCEQ